MIPPGRNTRVYRPANPLTSPTTQLHVCSGLHCSMVQAERRGTGEHSTVNLCCPDASRLCAWPCCGASLNSATLFLLMAQKIDGVKLMVNHALKKSKEEREAIAAKRAERE